MKCALLFIAILAACVLAAPAHAQTKNPPIFVDFSIDLVQGVDTIKNSNGQVVATENDLLISNELPADLEAQIAADPIYNFPTYVQNNLPSMIGPISDYSFLIDGGGGASLPDYSPTSPPVLLLSATGTTSLFPSAGSNIFTLVTNDLLDNSGSSAPVASNTQDFINNDQFFIEGTDPSGVQPAEGVVSVSYLQDNIVQVTPEAGSLGLLLAGLAGVGFFAWLLRRKASQA